MEKMLSQKDWSRMEQFKCPITYREVETINSMHISVSGKKKPGVILLATETLLVMGPAFTGGQEIIGPSSFD